MNFYSPKQFALFRILLGFYLLIHFTMLIPYAPEIWSNEGILPDPSLNLTYGILPNILNYLDRPDQVILIISLLCLLSFLLAFGIQRPIVAILLWYGWACLFNRNNLISNPGIPFVGWLLLACAIIPKGEPAPLFTKANKASWELPKIIFFGAWIIMALSYTLSGIDKLKSTSWVNGEAIHLLLENPLARNWWLREFMLELPALLLKLITWIILAVEVLFAPLSLINLTTRKYAWISMVAVHLGILTLVDFADLTCGMLMIHVFTFDNRWLKDSPVLSRFINY